MSAVEKIPAGYHTVTPYLIVDGAGQAEFYKEAECDGSAPTARPAGRVMHAEIRIGDSVVMLADEFPTWAIAVRARSAERPRA